MYSPIATTTFKFSDGTPLSKRDATFSPVSTPSGTKQQRLRYPSSPLLHWSSGRRYCSEPSALVDSGRSSLTSLGSQESLEDSLEETEVFSDYNTEDEFEIEDEYCQSENENIISKYERKWEEWTIPSSSINFSETAVSTTLRETIKKGYWHGGIRIHQRSARNLQEFEEFAHEVNTLCKIRHENIQLFMGICLDLPDETYGIVMSEVKGDSLYSHLHKHGHNFTAPSKLKILRQITEGMEYLHAKGINHGSLTSKLITIQHRVCISLSFPSITDRKLESYDLTYLSPEEIRGVSQIDSRNFSLSLKPTQYSDIFAFGTITYELMLLKLPFCNEPLVDLVWNVGNSHCQSLSLLPKSKFRSVIRRCWNLTKKTSFKEIMTSIQDNLSLPTCFRSSYSVSTPVELYATGK